MNIFVAGYFHSDKRHGPCEACDCHPVGATGQVCATDTGQCMCTNPSLAGRKCDQCPDLYFGFNPIMARLVVYFKYVPLQEDENSNIKATYFDTHRLKIILTSFRDRFQKLLFSF